MSWAIANNPDLVLGVMNALTGFVLKTALAFVICLGLSWLVKSPGRRFMLWSGFLYGAAAYWLWMARSVLTGKQVDSAAAAVSTSHSLAQPAMAGFGALPIPGSWAFSLGIALRVMGIAYLLVLTCLLVAHIKKHLQLKWVLGFTSQPPEEIAAAFSPLAKKLGVGRSRLLVLSGVASPATFGFVRPTILLPDACLEQDSSDLEVILRHELHHIRRWDFLWNGLAVASRAILFFHPACWYAVRRMQFDRELACDLAAVSDSPKGRAKYAECLIHFARLHSSQDPRNWGIDFAASSSHLQARVHAILAGNKKSPPWLVGLRIAGGAVLLAGFVSIAPSMEVLLSFVQQRVTQPSAAAISITPPTAQARVKATRRSRLSNRLSPPGDDTAIANAAEAPQVMDLSAGQSTESPDSTRSGGPQLLHRDSTAAAKGSKQQIVIPIDDPSGQVDKTGDHDHDQAVQQAATAATVLRRISALDRH